MGMKEYIVRYEDEVMQLLPDRMQEIVRCKDCEFYIKCEENDFNIPGFCMKINQPTDNEHYCADGVKK